MVSSKVYNIGFKSCHLDSLVQETVSKLISKENKNYHVGQIDFLINIGSFSYDQLILKAILRNINNISSILISSPKRNDSEHKESFVGKISDLNYEKNILLVYDENNNYFNIFPEEIEFINFKNQNEDEKINFYINSNKARCLYCDSVDCFDFSELSICNENVFQYVSCRKCMRDWVCEYKLHAVHTNS